MNIPVNSTDLLVVRYLVAKNLDHYSAPRKDLCAEIATATGQDVDDVYYSLKALRVRVNFLVKGGSGD